MIILGISDHYISGAAIIVDGRIVSAVAEERLARKKMVMGFPWKAIKSAMAIAGVEPKDLTEVAIASDWGHFLKEYVDFSDGVFGVKETFVRSLFFRVGSHISFLRSKIPILERLYYDLRKPAFEKRKQAIRQAMQLDFGITAPVTFVSHHLCHAAGAYYASGYDDALVATLDGAGDGDSSHVYSVKNGRFELLHSVPSFDSLGDYYGYVTQISGFKAGKHEGKITGLAAYGKPSLRHVFEKFFRYTNGSMRNVGNCFRHAALRKLKKALPEDYKREDLAATVQDLAEDVATAYVGHWCKKTGHRNVALAGGVFANVKINQRVHEIDGVASVFVFPAMSDEGIAAGAALVRHAERKGWEPAERACIDHVYLGPEFTDQQIEAALGAAEVSFKKAEDMPKQVAKLLADGKVVARFAGRMEYGPRALGNRSILYRPDSPSVNDWLNERLQRTEFMPFAPSTLAEDAAHCFVGIEGAENTARFMTITFDCTEQMKKSCPGVVHIDGTARPQIVHAHDNPEYHRIISEFKRLTGLSCIVNTSFNIHEEPIVCTPEDAIRAFKLGHLDVLAIGPFIAINPAVKAKDVERERAIA
ncbi:MAG: carbamoyltransferase C-terminal domain-containing protein [Alphaproteobacteria bacterium]